MRRSEILPWPTASWIGWCTQLTASSCKENRCAKNEAAKMARNDKSEESCGNGGVVESVESQNQASPSFHNPLEISPKAGEIPTAPTTTPWKSGKPNPGFPLSHRVLLCSKTERKTGGLRPPPCAAALRACRV